MYHLYMIEIKDWKIIELNTDDKVRLIQEIQNSTEGLVKSAGNFDTTIDQFDRSNLKVIAEVIDGFRDVSVLLKLDQVEGLTEFFKTDENVSKIIEGANGFKTMISRMVKVTEDFIFDEEPEAEANMENKLVTILKELFTEFTTLNFFA